MGKKRMRLVKQYVVVAADERPGKKSQRTREQKWLAPRDTTEVQDGRR